MGRKSGDMPSHPGRHHLASPGVRMCESTTNPRGPIEVRLARNAIDRDEVFRLRHRVLGEQGGHMARGLTLSNGRLVEHADSGADLFAAFDLNGRALAAVRRQPLMDVLAASDRYEPLRHVAMQLGGDIDTMSVSGRFIIDPAPGGANLALRVFASMLRAGAREGITHDLCWCDESRLHGRLRLGYADAQVRMLDDLGEPSKILTLGIAAKVSGPNSIIRLVRRVIAA